MCMTRQTWTRCATKNAVGEVHTTCTHFRAAMDSPVSAVDLCTSVASKRRGRPLGQTHTDTHHLSVRSYDVSNGSDVVLRHVEEHAIGRFWRLNEHAFFETLVWLAKLKSFTLTAQKLNTTQPSISNRINKLEELLNVKLSDRNSRQFELTPAGKRILRHAEAITTLSLELRELTSNDESTDIHVRIGVIEAATMTWLSEYLEAVGKYFPKTSFLIATGTSGELINRLKLNEVDIIFSGDTRNEPNIISTPLCKLDMSWFASPAKFDCSRVHDIWELADLPIVLTRPGSSGHSDVIEYFRSHGIINVPQRHNRISIDCIYANGTARQLVVSGIGIVVLPTFLMEEDIASGRAAVLPVKQALPVFSLAASQKTRTAKPIFRHLIEIAEETVTNYCATRKTKFIWR